MGLQKNFSKPAATWWTVTCTTRRTHRSRHHSYPRPRSFHLCCSTTSPPTQRRTGMSPLLPWTWTNCGRHHCNFIPCTLLHRWSLFRNGFLWASVTPSTQELDPSTSPGPSIRDLLISPTYLPLS